MLWLFILGSIVKPPIGAVYTTAFTVPLVGKQHVSLNVLNSKQACIILSGIVNKNGIAEYIISSEGNVNFKLDETLHNFVHKVKCKISNSLYDPYTDTAQLDVYVRPLFFKKKLVLRRENMKLFEMCKSFVPKKRVDLFEK